MDVASVTNIGKMRLINEDAIYVSGSEPPITVIVADGMGGHAAGKFASTTTVEYIKKRIAGKSVSQIGEKELKQLAEDASDALVEAALGREELYGTGTTLVLALVDRGLIKIANIGDSRAYILNKLGFSCVTKDHSYVQYLVDHGVITRDEAAQHPYKNVITRAVGMADVEADVYTLPFGRGDVLLVCTDGLTGHVKDEEMEKILASQDTAQNRVQQLVDLALARGGLDNISVAIVDYDDLVGCSLQNKYQIEALIAEGGMSHVYRARVPKQHNERVAIKVFRKELLSVPEIVDGFKREAYTCAKLHHKNIVRTLDVGKYGRLRYIVMEYVEGELLKDKIKKGEMGVETSADIAQKILDALAYAHHKGVVHKDLKPQNIIMREDGEPILIDFGIAEEVNDSRENRDTVFGTIHYFSPEQAMGETVDARTDVYSVGIMLYEMCTGILPFTGADNVSIALKHMHQPPKPPKEINPDLPESLNRIILKAIAKDRKDRYLSAAAMRRDLMRAFVEPDGAYVVLDEQTEAEVRKPKRFLKQMAIVLGGCVAVIAVLIVVMVVMIFSRPVDATVYMPSLYNRSAEEARELLESKDIAYEMQYESRMEYTEDVVITQTPEAGAVVEEGDVVTVTVSYGVAPDLMGMDKDAAIALLKQNGVKNYIIRYVEEGELNAVQGQDPAAGALLTESVVLYVCQG